MRLGCSSWRRTRRGGATGREALRGGTNSAACVPTLRTRRWHGCSHAAGCSRSSPRTWTACITRPAALTSLSCTALRTGTTVSSNSYPLALCCCRCCTATLALFWGACQGQGCILPVILLSSLCFPLVVSFYACFAIAALCHANGRRCSIRPCQEWPAYVTFSEKRRSQ